MDYGNICLDWICLVFIVLNFNSEKMEKNINTINFVIAGDTLLGSFVENNYIRKVNNKQKISQRTMIKGGTEK